MKILFVISNLNSLSKGSGGHYYSLLATAKALEEFHEIQIVNIGSQESMAFKDESLTIINILHRKLRLNILIYGLIDVIKEFKPDILHAFDEFAYFYVRIVNQRFKVPIVLTKCGGSNPLHFYPFCKNLIVYSKENLDYFKSTRKYRKSSLYLIPNRIIPIANDKTRIHELKLKYNLSYYNTVFLRISRIGHAYKDSIFNLIKMIEDLNGNNMKCCLFLIGSVEDDSVFKEICFRRNNDIFIETDRYFTKNANELIDLADVIMGTGRSFMEGALKNKLMMTPLNNGKNFTIVDENNFYELFSTNFSGRYIINNFDQNLENEKLLILLRNKSIREKMMNKNFSLYNENFNIRYSISRYNELYGSLKFRYSRGLLDCLLNYFFLRVMFFANTSVKRKNLKASKLS